MSASSCGMPQPPTRCWRSATQNEDSSGLCGVGDAHCLEFPINDFLQTPDPAAEREPAPQKQPGVHSQHVLQVRKRPADEPVRKVRAGTEGEHKLPVVILAEQVKRTKTHGNEGPLPVSAAPPGNHQYPPL